MLSLETRPLSVRSSTEAVSTGGAIGCLYREARTQMPGGSHLIECCRAPASSMLGGASWGTPRRKAAQGLQTAQPHHSSRAVVLKWTFGHVWRQFWLSWWGHSWQGCGCCEMPYSAQSRAAPD